VKQNPSWEANSHSASQEIPRLLCNTKIPILSRMNPIHTHPHYHLPMYA